jgi:hypothetical protein
MRYKARLFRLPGSIFYPFLYPDPMYPTDYNRVSKVRWVTAMVMVSAKDLLFSYHRKCFGMILNFSIGVPDFHPPVIVESQNRSRARFVKALKGIGTGRIWEWKNKS